jgi:hypothetical protein
MLLLPDGTVMGANGGNAWYQLTPDIHGSYINGTWTTLAAMHDTRLYYSSDILTNGRLFVAGGEYGTGRASAEIYDPLLNTWTMCAGSGAEFVDSISVLLPNGNILVAPVEPTQYGHTALYSPATDSWPLFPALVQGYNEDEASWVKLPDNSILTVDPYGATSERFIPSLNQWVSDATVPVPIYNSTLYEMGPALLLASGSVFFIGDAGYTALYIPSGTTSPGSWVAGPNEPAGLGAPDVPAAMMVNGKVLCAMGPPASYNAPTAFYEYDPVTNAFSAVTGPGSFTNNLIPYETRMLDLPDGSVLLAVSGTQLYVYQPDGSPLPSGQPAITSIKTNFYRSYHLTGTLLNGISQGAAYGDDAQMDSNYPLVRMTNAGGNVYYARTYNWSSNGVMTGSAPVTTEFMVPQNLPAGLYSLVVVANGNSSAPVSFTFAPDTLQISPLSGFAASAPSGGPVAAKSINYLLTNTDVAPLDWSIGNAPVWLTISAASGTLAPAGSASVTISLNAAAASSLPLGNYAATLWFTNLTTGAIQSAPFSYQSTPLVINGGFEYGSLAFWTLSGTDGGSTLGSTAYDSGQSTYVHSGFYSALLGTNSGPGYLSQTIPTLAGQTYTLSFWLKNISSLVTNSFAVSWNGSTLYTQTNLGTFSFTNLQFPVAGGGSGSSTLQFTFHNAKSFFGLDDVTLQVRTAAPVIIAQSSNQTAPVGSTVTFSVTASGTTPISYFWQRNGTNIVGATNNIYSATNVQFSDSGSQFTCLVSNMYGTALSSNAVLTVVAAPLVQNGGFELGTFTDWAQSGNSSENTVTSASPYVHSGTYGAELGPAGSLGYLSQTIPTVPGQLYQVSCWLYCNGQTPNEFSVSWNGATLFDQTNIGDTLWTNLQFLAPASAANTLLAFGYRNDPSYLGLDDIVVGLVPPPGFQAVAVANGAISFSWSALDGFSYQIQYTTNLAQNIWSNLGGAISATNAAVIATDAATADAQRFYRVLLLP